MPIVVPPAGVTPLGAFTGTFDGPLPPPPVIRADCIEPKEQRFTSVIKGDDPIDAAVVEALWRVRGSGGAVMDKGTRFLDIGKLTEQATRLIESEARNALKRMVVAGYITIKSVVVTLGDDWAEVDVSYLNNRAARDQLRVREVRVRLPEAVHG
jgi:hypothetical protein